MKTKNHHVVTIGNIGIDTNVYAGNEGIDFSKESSFTENLDYVGQAGGYTSRGFAQLGLESSFIGYIGNDFWGKYIVEELKKDKINIEGIFIDESGTSRSINIMYPDGTRNNMYDGKSHMNLEPDVEKCKQIMSNAKLVHFHIPNWARYLLPLVGNDTIISCDLQDFEDINDPYRKDFIRYSDILFFSSANQKNPENFIRNVLEKYPQKIIISGLGKKGCVLAHNDNILYFEPVKLKLPIIDTNGAGDSLAVGFLKSYIFDNKSLIDSVKIGQIAARHACSLKASTSDLISEDLMKKYMLLC